MKINVLTYMSYRELFELYNEINNSIAVDTYQIKLVKKDIISLSGAVVKIYTEGLHRGL